MQWEMPTALKGRPPAMGERPWKSWDRGNPCRGEQMPASMLQANKGRVKSTEKFKPIATIGFSSLWR
jgi:hypothetical protein